jgi:hypothetical protein
MKKTTLLLMMVAGLLIKAGAQDVKVVPAYWVVETNVQQRNFSIVRLYDSRNMLVHEVKMDGVYFDVSKANHRKKLNEMIKGYYPMMSKKDVRSIAKRSKTW